MAHRPRSSDRPVLDIPSSISDIVMQEFAAFGDTVAKLTDATVLLEHSRERREFFLVIGPSEDEERGATAIAPEEERPVPLAVTLEMSTNQPTLPASNPAPAPQAPPRPAPTFPPVHSSYLHLPGVRNDN